MSLAGARVVVLGLGVAGQSALAALRAEGAQVVTVDGSVPADAVALSPELARGADLVMASPGYAPSSADVLTALDAGIEVVSEMELAWRLRTADAPWVLVTGTNGKTTTTQMVGAMAAAGGVNVAVCGNMGVPVIEAARSDAELIAVEIASLQLHFTTTLAPAAAVCLNADVDHLDWHGSLDAYRSAKARVYANVVTACVYPAHDALVEQMVRAADVAEGCRAIGITPGAPDVSQLGVVDGLLVDRAFVDDRRNVALEMGAVSDLAHLSAQSVPEYLVTNALAAAALVRAVGVSPEAVGEGLRGFAMDHHRRAVVDTIDGVHYIDDSKATNAHAARAAMTGAPASSLVWIAGGQAKGQDLSALVESSREQLRAAVVLGLDPTPVTNALATHAPDIPVAVIEPGDTVMERAVEAARRFAQPGDTVLLSPACASYDQFDDYAHRGRAFAQAVRHIRDS